MACLQNTECSTMKATTCLLAESTYRRNTARTTTPAVLQVQSSSIVSMCTRIHYVNRYTRIIHNLQFICFLNIRCQTMCAFSELARGPHEATSHNGTFSFHLAWIVQPSTPKGQIQKLYQELKQVK